MTIVLTSLATSLAGLLLHATPTVPEAGEAPIDQDGAGVQRLRAHDAAAATLLMFVFGESRRLLVATPGVGRPSPSTSPAPQPRRWRRRCSARPVRRR